jgi:hypothetical protein
MTINLVVLQRLIQFVVLQRLIQFVVGGVFMVRWSVWGHVVLVQKML